MKELFEDNLYEKLVENAKNIIVGIDLRGNVIYFNKIVEKLTGYKSKDVIGKRRFTEFLPKDVKKEVLKLFMTSLKGKFPKSYIAPILKKNGEKVFVSWIGTFIRNKKGKVVAIFGIGQDVTEQKKAEEALKESEEKVRQNLDFLQMSLEGTNQGIWDWSLVTGEIKFDDNWPKVLGYKPEERKFDFKWWEKSVHPESFPVFEKAWSDYLKGKTRYYELEYQIKNKNGQYRWIWARGVCVKWGKNKKPLRVIGTHRDITEEKKAEEALKQSEERYRAIYENAPLLMDAFDKKGKCTLWNKECERVFGWKIDEINAHKNTLALFYPNPKIQKQVMLTVTSKPEGIFREWHPITKDGSELTTMWANFKLPDGAVMNIGYDITEKKKAEDALKQSEERYRNLIENSPDRIFIVDSTGTIVFVNDLKYLKMNKVIGHKAYDFVNPKLKNEWKKCLQQALIKGTIQDMTVTTTHNRIYRSRFVKVEPNIAMVISTDVTERKKSEEALKESEEKYRTLFEGLNEAAYKMSLPNGKYEYMNPAANSVFGYSHKEFLDNPKLIKEIIHPDFEGYFKEKWVDLIKGKVPKTYEYKIIDPKGKERWIIQSNKGAYDDKGNIIAIEGICRDITEQKKSEDALKESEEKLKAILNNSASVVFVKDLKGRYLFINRLYEKLFHITHDKIIGKTDYDVFPKKAADAFRKADLAVLKAKKPLEIEEAVPQDDGVHHYTSSKFPLYDADNKPYAVCGIATDVTEKKKSEELLFQSKVFESSITANSIADKKGIITHANPFFLKIWGFKNKKEVIGKPILHFFQNKEEAAAIIKALDKTGKWEGNYTAKRKDGSNFAAHGLATTITNEKGKTIGYQSTVLDVTEQKKAEEEIKKHRENLKELVEERTSKLIKSNEALKESETKHRLLYETSADAIMILEPPTWEFTSGNPATVKMFRTGTKKKFTSLGPGAVSPKYQPDGQLSSVKAKKMIMKAMKEGSNLFEWTHKRWKGEDFPAIVLLTRMEESGKKYLQATVRDISEQKKAEEALKENEEKFRLIFEGATEGILAADLKTKSFVFGNPKICEITGYSVKELLNVSVDKIHPKKDLHYVFEQFRKQAKGEVDVAKNIPVLRKDKSVIYCDVNSTVVNIKGQKLMLGFFREITERKKAEEELKESKNQLEKSMSDISFLYRMLTSISSLSKKKELLDFASNEIARAFNAEIVSILLLNKNTNKIIISCYGVKKEEYDEINTSLSKNPNKLGSTSIQNIILRFLKQYKIKSTINLPFEAKNDMRGVIQIFRLYNQEFTAEERRLSAIVSSHISTAIENIEFYNELKRNVKEIEEKNKELERFNKFAIGREMKMVELKNKIKRLEKRRC